MYSLFYCYLHMLRISAKCEKSKEKKRNIFFWLCIMRVKKFIIQFFKHNDDLLHSPHNEKNFEKSEQNEMKWNGIVQIQNSWHIHLKNFFFFPCSFAFLIKRSTVGSFIIFLFTYFHFDSQTDSFFCSLLKSHILKIIIPQTHWSPFIR